MKCRWNFCRSTVVFNIVLGFEMYCELKKKLPRETLLSCNSFNEISCSVVVGDKGEDVVEERLFSVYFKSCK